MNILEKFYNSASYKQPHKLEAKLVEYSDTFVIDMVGGDQKPDCCIGHFGYNFYIRTPKGLHYKKYKSIRSMFFAIKKVLKNNNLTLQSIGLKNGYKYRAVISA